MSVIEELNELAKRAETEGEKEIACCLHVILGAAKGGALGPLTMQCVGFARETLARIEHMKRSNPA